ncbi:hypothetical protein ASPZODRAFT_150099 [Penicilliopsis zonata CBS 506.65]|uniref:Methyltransferase domain-containing protein n=1 Tax=Penicilliopsis zonata CBS 506.65 TaxID=1073090 RepID=A0A1L9SPH7_9EURO|nr:hypothetical protein ASPZODRAFT_150099 [Penicilliopsis zonata CBS 506.65]OJJ49162.1 hypothetical protein ASPZODRAFT_150099 [Penicilliopsis zonata CBS 506.65]
MSDITESNRKYFDKLASTYKEQFGKTWMLIAKVVSEDRLWISDKWTDTEEGRDQKLHMLEYACGPGAVSIALAPFLTKVTGVDLSENMINEYNKNAQEANLVGKMTGFKGDLLTETVSAEFDGPGFFDFNIIAVSLALHHFENPGLAIERLGARLKKGGVLFFIDLVPEGHQHHRHGIMDEFDEASATIRVHGFNKEDMKRLYDDAGFTANFDYRIIPEPLELSKDGKTFKKTMFIARAQRE